MLTIPGPVNQHLCDGLSRRNFIKLGSLGLGLTLSDLFALEASSTARKQCLPVLHGPQSTPNRSCRRLALTGSNHQ